MCAFVFACLCDRTIDFNALPYYLVLFLPLPQSYYRDFSHAHTHTLLFWCVGKAMLRSNTALVYLVWFTWFALTPFTLIFQLLLFVHVWTLVPVSRDELDQILPIQNTVSNTNEISFLYPRSFWFYPFRVCLVIQSSASIVSHYWVKRLYRMVKYFC